MCLVPTRQAPVPVTEDDPMLQHELDRIAQRQLACAVIHQAVKDATTMRGMDTYTARRFLQGGDGLREWCEMADLRYRVVVDYAARHFPVSEETTCQRP